MDDLIPRKSIEYICRKETVSTNPDDHEYSDKFIEFMNNDMVADFGRWQWANGFNTALVTVKLELERVPSAQPEQIWIPCSERLPEEEIEVLVTRKFLGCKDGSHGWNNHIPPSTYVEVAQYFCGEWEALSDECKIARNRHTNPIAWMPLPEPYQEGEQE